MDAQPPQQLKILVVDDSRVYRMVLSDALREMGHVVEEAEDGSVAVARVQTFAPDLVLMDLEMPKMNGIEATRLIRELCGERWLPIIMLSTRGEEEGRINALNIGCDDYLTKPISQPILEAKINSFQRIATMQQQLEVHRTELQRFYAYAEEELSLTEHLMGRVIRRDAQQDPLLATWTQSALGASGDIIMASRSKGNTLYVMLADATGHGLASAVTLVPVANIFFNMVASGFSVPTIIKEMNKQVRTYCPTERFVAVTLLSVNLYERVIELWNGGNPAVLALDEQGHEVRRFKSRHLPVGVLSSGKFSSATECFHYDQSLQLALLSDGLAEATNGEEFGFARVVDALGGAKPAARLTALEHTLQQFMDGHDPHDDISVALVDCPLNYDPILHAPANLDIPPVNSALHRPIENPAWSMQVTLSAALLKEMDLVPMLLDWVVAMRLPKAQTPLFFVVISELFANALEHGLLALNSDMKATENGFEHYIENKQSRLKNLAEGSIQIALEQKFRDGFNVVDITVKDSGKGFDYRQQTINPSEREGSAAQRGIGLLRRLCHTLEYRGNGSEVHASFLYA